MFFCQPKIKRNSQMCRFMYNTQKISGQIIKFQMNVPQKRINVTLQPHHVSITLVTILVTLALVAMVFSK